MNMEEESLSPSSCGSVTGGGLSRKQGDGSGRAAGCRLSATSASGVGAIPGRGRGKGRGQGAEGNGVSMADPGSGSGTTDDFADIADMTDLDQDQDQDQEDQDPDQDQEESAGDNGSSGGGSQTLRSSSRVMRNLAEKMRRDKLNTHINELATLVPMVSTSSKRMDKTSILRLSVTFLRMNQILTEELSGSKHVIPQFFDSVNWSQLMLDDMEGIMMVVTSSGKIVFISPSVERTLGHLQLELLGQSLYNITCHEDHEILRKNLSPDQDPNSSSSQAQEMMNDDSCSSVDTVTFSNSSCSEQSCDQVNLSFRRNAWSSGQKDIEKQRRSFFIRLKMRSTSRIVQAQYEYVHVVGHLRVPVKPKHPASTATPRHVKPKESLVSPNDIILVAVVKPFKEMKVSDLTLIEASKDEYVTRHQMDGTFIYSDHRISIVSGYLSREVSGMSAFNFMHKDDVGWVLVALRQMFITTDGNGHSCYRLKTKTGQFIHLRTFGYLENSDSGQNDSFICINTLITEEEYKEEFASLQQRFTPMIENQKEPGLSAIASVLSTAKGSVGKCYGNTNAITNPIISAPDAETKDPQELNLAIKSLISDVVTTNPKLKVSDSSKSPRSPIIDAEHGHGQTSASSSKPFPQPPIPVVPKIGPSSVSTIRRSETSSKHRVGESVKQDRPSVLRVNHSSTDTVSVLTPNVISPSSQPKRKSVVSHSSQLSSEQSIISNSHYDLSNVPTHLQNCEEPLEDSLNLLTQQSASVVVERTGVLCRLNPMYPERERERESENDYERAGVVVKRKVFSEDSNLSMKRLRGARAALPPESDDKHLRMPMGPAMAEGAPLSALTSPSLVSLSHPHSHYSNHSSSLSLSLDTCSSSSLSDFPMNSHLLPTPAPSFSFNDTSSLLSCSLDLGSLAAPPIPPAPAAHVVRSHSDLLGMVVRDLAYQELGPLEPLDIGVDDVQSINQPVLQQSQSWSTETDVLEANLRRNHLELDSSMALQDEQLTAIEQDLTTVPHHMSSTLHSNFTQLKAQHKKQQQMLETLKQETLNHNLHHHSDELSTNIQQDVGV